MPELRIRIERTSPTFGPASLIAAMLSRWTSIASRVRPSPLSNLKSGGRCGCRRHTVRLIRRSWRSSLDVFCLNTFRGKFGKILLHVVAHRLRSSSITPAIPGGKVLARA